MTACGTATCPVAKNPAFWSITVYDAQGFIAPENSIVNSSTVKLKSDGTFTVFYGSKELCGDARNRSDTPESISFMMRVYRPDLSVRNGGYTPPPTISVKGYSGNSCLQTPSRDVKLSNRRFQKTVWALAQALLITGSARALTQGEPGSRPPVPTRSLDRWIRG